MRFGLRRATAGEMTAEGVDACLAEIMDMTSGIAREVGGESGSVD